MKKIIDKNIAVAICENCGFIKIIRFENKRAVAIEYECEQCSQQPYVVYVGWMEG